MLSVQPYCWHSGKDKQTKYDTFLYQGYALGQRNFSQNGYLHKSQSGPNFQKSYGMHTP